MEHCAGMILSNDRGPLVLSLAAETCCEWRAIAEEVAREQCDAMGRKRLVESQPWRRVLGHLCPAPRADTKLTGHTKAVQCVVQLADGRIVSGSLDNTLRVWDSGSGACILQLTGHTKAVQCVVQLADGRIVSGSWTILCECGTVAAGPASSSSQATQTR